MKYLYFILLFVSCSNYNKFEKEILNEIYLKEVELCKMILNETKYLDTLIKQENTSKIFKTEYERGYYNSLFEFINKKEIILLDINRSDIFKPNKSKILRLDIVFILKKELKQIDVIKFTFDYEINKFRLKYISENPYDYNEFRRPKVEPYYPLMPPKD